MLMMIVCWAAITNYAMHTKKLMMNVIIYKTDVIVRAAGADLFSIADDALNSCVVSMLVAGNVASVMTTA